MNLLKLKHGAGGFYFSTTNDKGNTRFGEAKKKAIIDAIQDSCSDGVYQQPSGKIIKQLLNGCSQNLVHDKNTNEFYFSS